jgi:D-xylose transport system substrate-binding protein
MAFRFLPDIPSHAVLLSLTISVACTEQSTPVAQASSTKVGFLLSTLQEERYEKDRRYFEQDAKAHDLDAFTLAADNDNARQLAQVEDALARGARVLVIQPTDSSAASSYVSKAHARGVKVVAYDRAIPGADFYVAHDSYRVGTMQAEEAVRATGGHGNYVLLLGQSGHSVASEIARGYRAVLAPYIERGDIKIVLERNHDSWSPEQALRTVEDAITKTRGEIQAILANNSGMARGAVQAVQAANLGDKHVFIAGADADAANVNYVCAHKQSVEVLKEIKPLAERAAEVAALLVQGKSPGPTMSVAGVPTVAVQVELITPERVPELVIASGFHGAAELPACKH